MGLFSRRKKSDSGPDGVAPDDLSADGTAADATAARGTAADDIAARGIEPGEQPVADAASEPVEPVVEVGISVSSFRGIGAPATPAPAADAPTSAPVPASGTSSTSVSAPAAGSDPAATAAPAAGGSIPGIRDNELLREALAALPARPEAGDLVNVARQLLQGHLFLRVQGDARALLSAGEPLTLAVAQRGDRQFVLAYSGAAALQASVRVDGDASGSVIAQPVLEVLKQVLSGPFEGLVLDNGSAPARAVLPAPLLRRALDEADHRLRLKTLLSSPRTAATTAEVVAALADAPVWIAVKAADEGAPMGVAELRTETGERYLEVFSHPLEALALGRGDRALPVTTEQLATALARDEALTGVVVDRGGPAMRVTRADLAPLLALAAT